jgi:hypothetical protein
VSETKAEDAKAAALRLLAARDRSTQELRIRLERRFAPAEVEKTIKYLQEIGYLDDLRFARIYVDYLHIGAIADYFTLFIHLAGPVKHFNAGNTPQGLAGLLHCNLDSIFPTLIRLTHKLDYLDHMTCQR